MMTGVNGLDKVISSIQKAKDVGLDVKINTVVVRGWNDDEVVDFANFARRPGITVRFIEFMPLDGTGIWRSDLVFSKREMIQKIETDIGKVLPSLEQEMSTPAKLYSFSDGMGTVGFIPSVTEPFCSQCDRVVPRRQADRRSPTFSQFGDGEAKAAPGPVPGPLPSRRRDIVG